MEFLFLSALHGWAVGFLLTRLSIFLARRYHVLAHPNERASHTIPTPRLGGIAIAGTVYLLVAMLDLQGQFPPALWRTGLLVGGAWAFIGGLLDDLLQLDPKPKFFFQFAAAGCALVAGIHALPEPVTSWIATRDQSWLPIASWIFSATFIIFFMNAYNFMDGMDGQAATFGALSALALELPRAVFGDRTFVGEVILLGSLAGALLGFFFFNRPSAALERKTFMGDCGSQFVGFVLAVMVLRCEQTTPRVFNFWSAVIVLSPFIWDVVYTLVRRLLRGENILQAHRTHLYQRLLVAGWTHGEVLALNFVLWGICFVLAQLHGRLLRAEADDWLPLVYCATALVLVLYTIFVLAVEFRTRRAAAQQAKASYS